MRASISGEVIREAGVEEVGTHSAPAMGERVMSTSVHQSSSIAFLMSRLVNHCTNTRIMARQNTVGGKAASPVMKSTRSCSDGEVDHSE
jgi:hypothetical protein